MLKPFDVCRFVLSPGKKLYGFEFEVDPTPGVFHKLFGLTSEAGVILLYASFSKTFDKYRVVAFLDFTNAYVEPKEILEKFRDTGLVRDINVIEPIVEGFIVDTSSHPLVIGNERVILIESSGFKYLINELREKFGTAGEAVLYYMGYEMGLGYGQVHRKMGDQLGLTSPREILEKVSIPIFQGSGLGIFNITEYREKPLLLRIRVYRSFECELGREYGREYSHIVRGILAGLTTNMFNREVAVREVRCIAKGDEYCEFEITEK